MDAGKGGKSLALMQRMLGNKSDDQNNSNTNNQQAQPQQQQQQMPTQGQAQNAQIQFSNQQLMSDQPVQQQQQQPIQPQNMMNMQLQQQQLQQQLQHQQLQQQQARQNANTPTGRTKGKDFAQMQRKSPDKSSSLNAQQQQLLQQQQQQQQLQQQRLLLQQQQQLQAQQQVSQQNLYNANQMQTQGQVPQQQAQQQVQTSTGVKGKGKDFANMTSLAPAPSNVNTMTDIARQNEARKAAGLPPMNLQQNSGGVIAPTPLNNMQAATNAQAQSGMSQLQMQQAALQQRRLSLQQQQQVQQQQQQQVQQQQVQQVQQQQVQQVQPNSMTMNTNMTGITNNPIAGQQVQQVQQQQAQQNQQAQQIQLQQAQLLEYQRRALQQNAQQQQIQQQQQQLLQQPGAGNLSNNIPATNMLQQQMQQQLQEAQKPAPVPTPKPTKAEAKISGKKRRGSATAASNKNEPAPPLVGIKLSSLIKSLDPSGLFTLEEDAEEQLLALANDFANSLIKKSMRVAQHRHSLPKEDGTTVTSDNANDGKRKRVEAQDVAIVLKKNYGITIPGLPVRSARRRNFGSYSQSGNVSLATAKSLKSIGTSSKSVTQDDADTTSLQSTDPALGMSDGALPLP